MAAAREGLANRHDEPRGRPVTPPLPRTLRWRVCVVNLAAMVAERALVLLFPSEVPK